MVPRWFRDVSEAGTRAVAPQRCLTRSVMRQALAELGALDEEVQGLVHDATNAVVTPGSAVATEREKQAS